MMMMMMIRTMIMMMTIMMMMMLELTRYQEDIGINHAVQLVGYGTDPELGSFWLARNSWGSGWGEGGYIRLRREEGRLCGRDSALCAGAPSVEVCGQCGLLFDVSFPLGVHEWPSL